ncbi:MAG: hypothetical protein KBF40_11765 [Giesbergeria sp.]|jgi:hypothetical protein|nr:hypothetical protein [Giesbergeria sp.]MBP6159152.1 hypothetical protein [Giesbergeria sp.]MBP7082933.1 hypothetical protein [Giesbergeria sp.]MBP9785451.1 hypothetical protein [Giesbergeria sp.]MBP9896001.1 hypothetical protein [Giesbergeria sp.]
MAHSNLLGGDSIAVQPDGRSAEALGTSGNSDSGSDVVGTLSRAELQSDSDATGTGEQSDVERDNAAAASDIRPDRVRGSEGLQAPGTAAREIDQLASDDDAAPGEDPSV